MTVSSRCRLFFSFVAILGLAAVGWAQQSKDSGTRRMMREAAATVDFRKALGVPFEGLTTIGARIEQARTASDPVCLAVLATELGVAEKVSGKKASLTSDEVMKEA